MEKIAGVVILYNPDDKTWSNILSYVADLGILLVMDNSDIPNESLVKQLKSIPNVHYIKNSENMGIAYPLNKALEMTKDNYQWLLTMDQDSSFKQSDFKKYLENLNNITSDIYGVTPALTDSIIPKGDGETSMVENCITSGMLLRISAAVAVGGFDEKMFIDAVDDEFCFRANEQKQGKIVRDNRIILDHRIGNPVKHHITGVRSFTTDNHSALRKYYMFRNYPYVADRYPEKKSMYKTVLIKNFIKIILGEKDKIKKIKCAVQGYKDYNKGKMGKYKT